MKFDSILKDGKPDLEKINRITDENLKRSMIEVSHVVGEILARDVDEETTCANLFAALQTAHDAGITKDEIIEIVLQVKDAVSYTWHPTNNLSPEGTRLRLQYIQSFEIEDRDERLEAIAKAKAELIASEDLTPEEKATMVDEIDANLPIADRDNKGANRTERAFESGIQEIWGGERPDLSMNLAGRTWIYDADGKNNNEGWAMIAALTTLKKEMFEQTIDALDDDLIARHPHLKDLKDDLTKVLENLDKVWEKSRRITSEMASLPVEDREAYYKEHYAELQETKDDLRALYKCVGDEEGRGHNFFVKTKELLGQVRELEGCQADHDSKLDNAYRTLRRNGFTLQKGQTRHNGIVYSEVIDNLFAHEEFLNSRFLRDEDRKLIRGVEKFSDLHDNQRRMIMYNVTRETKDRAVREELRAFFRDANPLEFDPKNGYPTSGSAVEDRMDILSIFKRNFAELIISDASASSAIDQIFIAKIEGAPGAKHMMLNEDQKTLPIQPTIASEFGQSVDAEEAEKHRVSGQSTHYSEGDDNEIRIMIPSSDSMRNGGPGTLLQMCNTVREATREAIKLGKPIEIMLGSGGSMGRFGCDQAMVRRLVAQTLQQVAKEQGFYEWDPNSKDHKTALRMAKVVMHTEQGRMPNIQSASSMQIALRHMSRATEMIEDHMELTGVVDPGKYIDPVPELSAPMQRKALELQENMIGDFSDFRQAYGEEYLEDDTSDRILNSMADKAMFPYLAPFINHGARPAAKGNKKGITDVRAIENDKRKAMAELFDSSFYSSGAAMRSLHEAVNSNKTAQDRCINGQSVIDLMEQPDWNFLIFAKGVTEAMRFEATKKFETLSGGPGNWDFDKAVEIGKSVELKKIDPNDPESDSIMDFDDQGGTITQEEAYLAKIYYDRLLFLALTEASLKGELNRDLDGIINDFRPADGSLEFLPGEQTLEAWPVAQEVHDNHRKNDEMLDMVQQIESYFKYRIEEEGATKDDVIAEFGGEANLRKICSAYMEGTQSHLGSFGVGRVNYGIAARSQNRPHVGAMQREVGAQPLYQ